MKLTTPIHYTVLSLTTPIHHTVLSLTTPVHHTVLSLTTPVHCTVLSLTTSIHYTVLSLTTPVLNTVRQSKRRLQYCHLPHHTTTATLSISRKTDTGGNCHEKNTRYNITTHHTTPILNTVRQSKRRLQYCHSPHHTTLSVSRRNYTKDTATHYTPPTLEPFPRQHQGC